MTLKKGMYNQKSMANVKWRYVPLTKSNGPTPRPRYVIMCVIMYVIRYVIMYVIMYVIIYVIMYVIANYSKTAEFAVNQGLIV